MQFPEKYNPQELEIKWTDFWEKNRTYRWDSSKNKSETFVVDTPPPTVSGSLHLGHMFSYTHTDLIVRYQRMLGKNIFYPMGWDDNGLPTERRVQNVFGVRCDLQTEYNPNFAPRRDKGDKEPVEIISRSNFIELCSLLTAEDEKVFEHLFKRMALSVDWSLQYATIDDHCRKVSQASFLDLVEKGELEHKKTPTQWDVDFQTAIAQAEVEDREVAGFYHDIRFAIEGGGDVIISTTRPEMLPACIALVAHPEDERYQKYFGKFALTPLFGARVPVLASTHADKEKGTGILMVCTFGDSADVDWWKQSKLPLKQILNLKGELSPVEFGQAPFESVNVKLAQESYAQIQGMYVKKAQKKIAELLKDFLVGELKPTQRSVKFYEKGDRPLEFIPTRQWYVNILKHKDALLKMGEKIDWHPEHMKTRYEHWVKGLNQDWCISRQRYFGVAFPVWYPVKQDGDIDYAHPIFAKLEQLPVDPLKDIPAGFKPEQRDVPGGFTGEKDVMDTWATSSLTPQISSHWPMEPDRHKKLFPADMRPQSHEIIRTWAFYTILKAYLHSNNIPWKNIAISGWILDPDRKKMSKSKGNVVTPENYLDQYSADAVRYWAARARLGMDTAFDEKVFQMGWKICNKLFNASKFVLGLGTSSLDLSKVENKLDQSWLSLMQQTTEHATSYFEKFDYAGALQVTEERFWEFCDHYVELVKVRAYQGDALEKESALAVLTFSLNTFLKLFAPFFPYLTEEIWQWNHSGSIHQSIWPREDSTFLTLLGSKGPWGHDNIYFTLARECLGLIRTEKTKAQKPLKTEINSLHLNVQRNYEEQFKLIQKDVFLAGNVKITKDEIQYVDLVGHFEIIKPPSFAE